MFSFLQCAFFLALFPSVIFRQFLGGRCLVNPTRQYWVTQSYHLGMEEPQPCIVCATATKLTCGCKKANYCSPQCQKADWHQFLCYAWKFVLPPLIPKQVNVLQVWDRFPPNIEPQINYLDPNHLSKWKIETVFGQNTSHSAPLWSWDLLAWGGAWACSPPGGFHLVRYLYLFLDIFAMKRIPHWQVRIPWVFQDLGLWIWLGIIISDAVLPD